MPSFKHRGHRLSYETRGEGNRPLVLLHGLLLNRSMHFPLADALAERGNRVILLDLLGHGESDHPRDLNKYSMPAYGEQVIALLDHLQIDRAVIGGTSLGANVTLEAAYRGPERMRGLFIEMPVLDNALLACALVFTPMLVAATLGAPITGPVSSLFRHVPRGLSYWVDLALDYVSQDPRPAGAVLQGLFFGRAAPPSDKRREIDVPAIVFGHSRDMIHPFSDAQMLATELPRGRLVEAESFWEMRFRPSRLTTEIGNFVDECWRPRKAEPKTASRVKA